MKFVWFGFIFLNILLASAAWAQDVKTDTPRTRIIHALTSIQSDSKSAQETAIQPDADAKLEPSKNTPKVVNILAPFYLTAKEYNALRGKNTHPQTILHYDVVSGPLSGSSLSTVQKIKLIIGNDFVSMTAGKTRTLYDYKLNRIITLRPIYDKDGGLTDMVLFENTSLYAKVYRNINTVRQATHDGRLQTITLADGQELDGFWVESAMSWSPAASKNVLSIQADAHTLDISKDGDNIFSAKFAQDKFSHAAHKDSFIAFAYNQWPLHPEVLSALSAYDTPFEHIKMVSYSPRALKGQMQEWTLTSAEHVEAGFPLPIDVQSIHERTSTPPLALAIDAAARGKALGGPPQLADLTAEFQNEAGAKNMLDLWVIGQRYNAYTGACDRKNTDEICASLDQIQSENAHGSDRLQNYIKATAWARTSKTRGKAVNMLTPYLKDDSVPAFVLRTAAMARAKMNPADIQRAGLVKTKAEDMLKRAVIKDPYDPNTYIGLAQVLAVSGAFEQSWDVSDALRAGILTHGISDVKIGAKISGVEKSLRIKAPGYFLKQKTE